MSAELKSLYAALPHTTRGQATILNGSAAKNTLLYTHSDAVYIRDIENPANSDMYADHKQDTTVAKYSPSGFYIASADKSGKVRIWDTVNPDHITKNEFQPFSGPVKDLDWSGDNQRMVVVGQGQEKFAHVFNAETGASLGEMRGHGKPINSAAFKPNRPFRIATGSEDQTVCFYHGPPFKFNMSMEDHKNFVNCVRYTSDGSKFITCGSDGQVFVYDGKTGENCGSLGSPAHKGGIYQACFSPDNSEVITVSGDKTAKIWNVESGECQVEFSFGTTIQDMQLGCLWQGDYIVTLSLSGNINYLDRNNPGSPARVVTGHSKLITCLNARGDTLYACDGDGKVCVWDCATGFAHQISGSGHSAQVQSMSLAGDTLVTCSIDDSVRFIDTQTNAFTDVRVKLKSQPQDVATSVDGCTVVACNNELLVLQNGNQVFELPVKYDPSSVTIHPSQLEVAVGGLQDNSVHVYSLSNGTLSEVQLLKQNGSVTCVGYSPDGAYLASGNSNRKVCLYAAADAYKALVTDIWTSHTAKILCLAWSPSSQYIASGGIDASVCIWDTTNFDKRLKIDRAHKQKAASAVAWRTDNDLVSAGHDANIKLWTVTHK